MYMVPKEKYMLLKVNGCGFPTIAGRCGSFIVAGRCGFLIIAGRCGFLIIAGRCGFLIIAEVLAFYTSLYHTIYILSLKKRTTFSCPKLYSL